MSLKVERSAAQAALAEAVGPGGDPTARPRYTQPSYRFLKRSADIVLSGFALLVLFPVFFGLTLVIAAMDGFPVVFKQRRLGEGGRVFTMFKFRSMRKNAEEILRSDPKLMEEFQKSFKLKNDPRLLPCGAFIRKTTLDELPQLFNVFKGEMSLVGPRPIVEKEIEKYGEFAWVYLAMKPGCAGLWQCGGRSDLDYAERIRLDHEYFMTAGFRRDFLVIWNTLGAIFKQKGAF